VVASPSPATTGSAGAAPRIFNEINEYRLSRRCRCVLCPRDHSHRRCEVLPRSAFISRRVGGGSRSGFFPHVKIRSAGDRTRRIRGGRASQVFGHAIVRGMCRHQSSLERRWVFLPRPSFTGRSSSFCAAYAAQKSHSFVAQTSQLCMENGIFPLCNAFSC
jgi:hypothetical protein